MSYSRDLAGSARRHLASGQRLYDEDATGKNVGHNAVAGYLFGLAGELALKKIMIESGMRPFVTDNRRDDPFYAHFPELIKLLKLNVSGRRNGELLSYANNHNLFQNWNTDMRYAPTGDIKPEWVEKWKKHAELLIDKLGL